MEGSMREEPMIRHLFITVQDPKQAAEILANSWVELRRRSRLTPEASDIGKGGFNRSHDILLPTGSAAKR
jgi:hypothetical protein